MLRIALLCDPPQKDRIEKQTLLLSFIPQDKLADSQPFPIRSADGVALHVRKRPPGIRLGYSETDGSRRDPAVAVRRLLRTADARNKNEQQHSRSEYRICPLTLFHCCSDFNSNRPSGRLPIRQRPEASLCDRKRNSTFFRSNRIET